MNKIIGYRDLSNEDLEIKQVPEHDKDWLYDGTMQMKKGIMALTRSIAKPTSV